MAKIRIVGDSSGYVELAAPNAAGNNTLELPSNATKLVGADASNSLNVTGIATFSSGITVGTGASISSPATNVLTLGTNNVERIRVGAGGSVNIGATDTSYKLQVTGAPQNTNNFGILHIRDSQTLSGAAGTGGIFLSSSPGTDYYIAKGYNGSNTKLKFGNGNNGNEYMGIDDSGRVTMPYQPVFYAYQTDGISVSSTGIFNSTQWNATLVNTGSHFTTSNGRFTAPVAGVYMFQIKVLVRHVGSTGAAEISLYKNGVNVVGRSFGYEYMVTAGDHATLTALAYLSLNIDDYVQMGVYSLSSGLDVYYGQNLGSFCGQLVG